MKKQLRSRFLAMMIPLTLLFVFVAQSAYGANPTKKLLTLSFNKTPLATALKAVEKKSGCKVGCSKFESKIRYKKWCYFGAAKLLIFNTLIYEIVL